MLAFFHMIWKSDRNVLTLNKSLSAREDKLHLLLCWWDTTDKLLKFHFMMDGFFDLFPYIRVYPFFFTAFLRRQPWHINKVIALRGSTPKRESQQQCSCTNNTANHAMLCHTMTYNATPYNLCNAIRCHTMQHHDHHAMQHHTTPFLAMQWHTMQYNAIHCYATPCNTIL